MNSMSAVSSLAAGWRGSRQGLAVVISIASLCSIGWVATVAAEETPGGPWECSGYSGDAHTRCLQTYIEVQRDKVSKLESELRHQQATMNELRDRVDRQQATTADLERQLSDRASDRAYLAPMAPYYGYGYGYGYGAPSFGLGLSFGRPWYYGSSYFYPPLLGPRLFIGPQFHFGTRSLWHRPFRYCRGRCW